MMTGWWVDIAVFLLLCAGARLATPRLLKLLCRLAVFYLVAFSAGYYLWLRPQFVDFKTHLHPFPTGIITAFTFEGFWQLLGNMVLMQGILPVALVFIVYFGVKWLELPGRGLQL